MAPRTRSQLREKVVCMDNTREPHAFVLSKRTDIELE